MSSVVFLQPKTAAVPLVETRLVASHPEVVDKGPVRRELGGGELDWLGELEQALAHCRTRSSGVCARRDMIR